MKLFPVGGRGQRSDTIEEQMTEVEGVGRRTKVLVDLRNRKRYWVLKEEVEDRKRWKQQFITRT